MNKLAIVFCVLFSFNLLACPNLVGTYACQDPQTGKSVTFSIEQTGNTYLQKFSDGELQIIADGVGRNYSIDDEGIKIVGVFTARCNANVLLTDTRGSVSYEGKAFLFDEQNEMSLDSQGNYLQNTKGASEGRPYEGTITCQRQ